MKRLTFLTVVLIVLPCVASPQQEKHVLGGARRSTVQKSITSKAHISAADTSENGLVNRLMRVMDRSGTVIDGELISKKSHWRLVEHSFFPRGDSEIYTVYTFKVFHWIKGSMQGNKMSFWQWGGRIGMAEEIATPATHFDLHLRGFFFFNNKKPNTQWIKQGVLQIFGAVHGRSGQVFIGAYRVNPDYYSEVLKRTAIDSTTYRRFIHGLKTHKIYGPLLWPSRLDSAQLRRGMKLISSAETRAK